MSDADRANRPTLGHLLLFITFCAVFFALASRIADRENPNDRPPLPLTGLLELSAVSVFVGVCWTGAAVVIVRQQTSSRLRTEPGEWLLFCMGLVIAIQFTSWLLPESFIVRRESLPMAATCLAFVIPTLSRHLPAVWKIFFALLVASYAIPLTATLLIAFGRPPGGLETEIITVSQTVRPYIVLAAAIVAIYRDRVDRRSYRWSHWLGVICTVVWVFVLALKL